MKIRSLALVFGMIVGNAHALNEHLGVAVIGEDIQTTFFQINSKYGELSSKVSSGRRNFEKQSDYRSRIAKNKDALNSYLGKRYQTQFAPDDAVLDWENSYVTLSATFSRSVLRERGGASPTRRIDIGFTVQPELAREIVTFRSEVLVQMIFSLSDRGEYLVESLIVRYRGKELHSE